MILIEQGGALREPKDNKLRYDLIPLAQLKKLAIHYTNGNKVHGERNRERGNYQFAAVCRQAAFRHFIQRMNGEQDEDHLSACIWNMRAYTDLLDNNPPWQPDSQFRTDSCPTK